MKETEEPPDLDTIRQRLRDLPNAAGIKQSTQKRIRDLLPEIEEAIEQGVPRTKIVGELNAMGIAITLPSFATALQRARKKGDRKKRGPTGQPSATPPPVPAGLNFAAAAEQVADHFVTSHDSDLVKRMKEREKKQ